MTILGVHSPVMPKMYVERIAAHYRFILNVPEQNLHMDYFFSDVKPDSLRPHCPVYLATDKPPRATACNTAACWAGWLPVSLPTFWTSRSGQPRLWTSAAEGVGFGSHCYSEIGEFFGLTILEVNYLCTPKSYLGHPTKQDVLNRTVEVVKWHGWDISSGFPHRSEPIKMPSKRWFEQKRDGDYEITAGNPNFPQ